ncbi:hypothetical protein LF63_0111470 [Oleiagrimonas soli]|uniref:Spore coat protein U/FanG domain-containing protein n=1 Tax=Oleiagrimonas soli TaxID=1543381 RepID=A0A099CTI3_9GAMM|nr:hypothetical protein LF63_0111470 [Oleiagrimonas soli]
MVLLGLGLIAPRAQAAVCGTVLSPVSASATAVNFGVYDPASGNADQSSGTVTVSCGIPLDVLPSFTISLSRGQAASYAPRRMASGANTLSYNLYTDAARATVWGDGSAGTSTVTRSGTLLLGSVSLTVYGAVPTGQYVAPGSYADTITVTVSY